VALGERKGTFSPAIIYKMQFSAGEADNRLRWFSTYLSP